MIVGHARASYAALVLVSKTTCQQVGFNIPCATCEQRIVSLCEPLAPRLALRIPNQEATLQIFEKDLKVQVALCLCLCQLVKAATRAGIWVGAPPVLAAQQCRASRHRSRIEPQPRR